MHIPPKCFVRLLIALALLILLLTACSVPDAGTDSDPAATALRPGTTLWSYQGISNVFTAAWSPDGHFLAIGEADGTVQVRDALTGTITVSPYGHTGAVWSIAWSPDGKRLATASWDATVQVWQARTGQHLLTYRGHRDIIGSVAWSPDEQRIASAADDVQVWQAS
jgi:WD40 repeat protein